MNTIKHTTEFEIAQPIDLLLPLFRPEGEKWWVPGWDYVTIMGTTDLSADYIFLKGELDANVPFVPAGARDQLAALGQRWKPLKEQYNSMVQNIAEFNQLCHSSGIGKITMPK